MSRGERGGCTNFLKNKVNGFTWGETCSRVMGCHETHRRGTRRARPTFNWEGVGVTSSERSQDQKGKRGETENCGPEKEWGVRVKLERDEAIKQNTGLRLPPKRTAAWDKCEEGRECGAKDLVG